MPNHIPNFINCRAVAGRRERTADALSIIPNAGRLPCQTIQLDLSATLIGTSYANVASFGQTIGADSDKRSASKPPKNQID